MGNRHLYYMGSPYLQVARYKERYFVRDGYHRAAGLLRVGVREVPCILVEASTFEDAQLSPCYSAVCCAPSSMV
jgi:hypothetical protein